MRFTLTRLLAALAALTMTVTAPAWAENGSNKLQDYLNRTQSLSARFHQQLLDEDRIELQQSKGSVLIERPMRFRWDYVEPFPQLIVTNGERFWLYDSELKQVTIRPVDQALGRSPAMVLSTDKPLDEEFD
ncbi:MAG: outer membrane lipoprotein chaperone LolA, partial [Gammaproteobacteria bacterium]